MTTDINLASALRGATSKFFKRLKQEFHLQEILNGKADLSMTALGTLANLYHGKGYYPSELAALEHVKTQSMSQILNELEALQLIIKTPSEKDKRKIGITLSTYGKEVVEQTRLLRDQWLAKAIAENLTDKQRATLEETVEILQTLANVK